MQRSPVALAAQYDPVGDALFVGVAERLRWGVVNGRRFVAVDVMTLTGLLSLPRPLRNLPSREGKAS